MEDNSHAGQGAVVLDIGGDVGALVIRMPADLLGVEIEARPAGAGDRADGPDHRHDPAHDHRHGHGHGHGHGHDGHGHDHDGHDHDGHGHGHGKLEHVAVLARPLPQGGVLHSAVFPALRAGEYELYQRPAGPVRLSVEVRGGSVTDAIWS